jgi:hypothetical protein
VPAIQSRQRDRGVSHESVVRRVPLADVQVGATYTLHTARSHCGCVQFVGVRLGQQQSLRSLRRQRASRRRVRHERTMRHRRNAAVSTDRQPVAHAAVHAGVHVAVPIAGASSVTTHGDLTHRRDRARAPNLARCLRTPATRVCATSTRAVRRVLASRARRSSSV